MLKYRVQIRGRNVLISVDGLPKRMGFYTDVFVEAATSEEAKVKGSRLIENDQKLKASALNQNNNPFELSVAEWEQIDSFEGRTLPRSGLIFFPEERGAKS